MIKVIMIKENRTKVTIKIKNETGSEINKQLLFKN